MKPSSPRFFLAKCISILLPGHDDDDRLGEGWGGGEPVRFGYYNTRPSPPPPTPHNWNGGRAFLTFFLSTSLPSFIYPFISRHSLSFIPLGVSPLDHFLFTFPYTSSFSFFHSSPLNPFLSCFSSHFSLPSTFPVIFLHSFLSIHPSLIIPHHLSLVINPSSFIRLHQASFSRTTIK